jgi:hypothetical protein
VCVCALFDCALVVVVVVATQYAPVWVALRVAHCSLSA